jgi:outer membrane immunogenic protein
MIRLCTRACVVMFCLIAAVSAYAGDFKGFYVGGNVGGVSGSNVNAFTTTVFSPTGYFATVSVPEVATAGAQTLSPSGFTGGGQVGVNLQHHAFVFGVETDFGSMNASAKKSTGGIYSCCPPPNNTFTVTQFVGTSWLFTLRPRIGFTGGPVMVYGTGGLAVTNYEYTALFTDTFATAEENGGKTSNQTGWVAGVGAEFKLNHHWSLKGEYLRAHFGGASTTTSTNLTAFTPPVPFPSNVFTHQVGDLGGMNIYRFGFNYRFGL